MHVSTSYAYFELWGLLKLRAALTEGTTPSVDCSDSCSMSR